MFALPFIVALFASQALPVAPVDLPNQDLPGGAIWFPSTELRREVSPVPHGDSGLFVATHGGLALYDTVTGGATFSRLPEFDPISPSGRRFPLRIGRLEGVDDQVWVATRSGGIHVFDPESMSFERVISLGQGRSGANLDLVRDPFNDDLWVSRFQHLDQYDSERQAWVNHAPFVATGFRAPSMARVFPDDRWIWVAAQGGLLQWDKRKKTWSRFAAELADPTKRPSSLMPRDVVIGSDHVWVLLTHGNGYNFYVAVFDKAAGSWTSYPRTDGAGPIEQMAEELPELRWRGGMNFSATLRDMADSAPTLLGSHPHRFSPDEQRTLIRMADTVESALERHRLFDVLDHGYARDKLPDDTALPDIAFTALVGYDQVCRVLVFTRRGLGLVDLDERRFLPIGPLPFSVGPGTLALSVHGGTRFVLDPNWEMGDGPPSLDLYWVDLERLETVTIQRPSPGGFGRAGDRLAVRRGETVQVYDEEKGVWVDLDDGADSTFVRAVRLPGVIDLPGRGSVELATDGLVFSP